MRRPVQPYRRPAAPAQPAPDPPGAARGPFAAALPPETPADRERRRLALTAARCHRDGARIAARAARLEAAGRHGDARVALTAAGDARATGDRYAALAVRGGAS